jgi:uncharacterized membrane protein
MNEKTIDDNDLRSYFNQIKSLLPIFGKEEKKFFAYFREEVDEFLAANPECDFEQLVEYFGKPNEIVSEYIGNADLKYLTNRIRIAKHMKLFIAIVLILAVVATLTAFALDYKLYLEAKNAEVHEIETILEEY